MRDINSKALSTDRLDLRIPTMDEQYRLWEILTNDNVNKYYFPTPNRIFKMNELSKDNIVDLKYAREIFMKDFKNWEIQKLFYKEKIESIRRGDDSSKFTWSVFFKRF